MKFKKLLALLLVAGLALSLFTGCGPKQASDQKSPTAEEKTDAAKAESDKDSVQAKPEEKTDATTQDTPSWKKDTSPYTIKWFVAYDWYGKTFDPNVNLIDKLVLEETGCTIEFQTGNVDKLNVLISTGSLPDVITYDANSSQRLLMEKDGHLLPLDELRDQYAPDFIVPQSMIDWYRAKDGHWYSFANYYYGEDNVTKNKGFIETHNQNFARRDILEQIGMTADDMRTKDGFLKALRAVKKQNIQYNGKSVLPYMANEIESDLAEQFGASMETKDGNYQSIYRTPEYLEALLFLNQLYREGLMTDESFTAQRSQVEQKVAAGEVFAVSRWTNASLARNTLFANDPDAAMLYCGLIQGDQHNKVVVKGNNDAGWAGTMISKNAEKPDRIIQLFAFLSQDKFTLDCVWGLDGYKLENGKVVRNEDIIKLQSENPKEYDAKYGGLDWLSDYTVVQGTYPEGTTMFDQDVDARTRDSAVTIYDDKPFTATNPIAGSDEAAIQSRVKEYAKQEVVQVITAPSEDEVRTRYQAMMTELDNLGLEKLEAFQNGLFQANKERLGLKFAHPFNQ